MRPLDEIADTLQSTPEVLRALLAPLDPDVLRIQPEPGEWCVLEVIGHLISADGPGFRDRIGGIVDGKPEIAPYDESLELTGRDFVSEDPALLLDELAAERVTSGNFLRALAPADLDRQADYRPHGKLAAGDFVHEWPFHDQNHLQQILAAIQPSYLPHMTDTMRNHLAP